MKRLLVLLLALFMLGSSAACSRSPSGEADNSIAAPTTVGKTVGISFPNETDPCWKNDCAALSEKLETLGCQVVPAYAADNPSLQAYQIAAMIAQPVDCLVVAAVDSLALTDVLRQAADAGIPVIAYDRLLMYTDAVSYYVGFDNEAVGISIAEHIVAEKQLESAKAESRSYTVEFFMGSPDDNNAVLLHWGIMQILQPYLDSGVLVCRTGRTAFEDVCIQGWSEEIAANDCKKYLTRFYTDRAPDICCAASDSIAQGCRTALEGAGYGAGERWPLITGQNATLSAVKSILSGHQSMTVYKDRAALIRDCEAAVTAVLTLTPAENANAVCHNGTMAVTAFLSAPIAVDKQNYREILVDSGVFSDEQLSIQAE